VELIYRLFERFFDRVFVSGFAFRYVNHRSRGLLSGQAVVFHHLDRQGFGKG